MRHLKASLVTAGAAVLLITANALGAVFAAKNVGNVPSYTSTAPTVTPVAATYSNGSVSEEAAIETAKQALESEFGIEIGDQFATTTAETDFDGTPVWYVGFTKGYSKLQPVTDETVLVEISTLTSDCYSAYVDCKTAAVLSTEKGLITLAPNLKAYEESETGYAIVTDDGTTQPGEPFPFKESETVPSKTPEEYPSGIKNK